MPVRCEQSFHDTLRCTSPQVVREPPAHRVTPLAQHRYRLSPPTVTAHYGGFAEQSGPDAVADAELRTAQAAHSEVTRSEPRGSTG